MKVSELIAELQNRDPDTEVYLTYDYGDRCGSIVAEQVENVESTTLQWSEYHRRYQVTDDDENEEDNRHPPVDAVILG